MIQIFFINVVLNRKNRSKEVSKTSRKSFRLNWDSVSLRVSAWGLTSPAFYWLHSNWIYFPVFPIWLKMCRHLRSDRQWIQSSMYSLIQNYIQFPRKTRQMKNNCLNLWPLSEYCINTFVREWKSITKSI